MSIIATASIESDLNFTLIKLGSSTQNESASLDYSTSLSAGTGSLQINYGVISSGSLSAGAKQYFDFRSLDKLTFGVTADIQFSKLKSIVVENRSTVYSRNLTIFATGVNALDELFNGGSGNLVIKPYGTYSYSDVMSGCTVNATNKDLTIKNVGASSIDWAMVVVGITG